MPFAVRLLNNDHTPMQVVVEALQEVFGKSREEASAIMLAIHQGGAGVCGVFDLDEARDKAARVAELAAGHRTPLACAIEPALDPEALARPRGEPRMIRVDADVELAVFDWKGEGPPLVFIPGLGHGAPVFEAFARNFTGDHHVYGVTRRGFGRSGKPPPLPENYATDRLGDDILAVMDALGLERPILVGHSFGGAELSSIGTRYPDRVSGLIYLDAGFAYALWTEASHWQGMLHKVIGRLEARWANRLPARPKEFGPGQAILQGTRKFTSLEVPALAIFAMPPGYSDEEIEASGTAAIADAFRAAAPGSRVVLMKNADHFVFNSNEAEVLAEMKAFLAGLMVGAGTARESGPRS